MFVLPSAKLAEEPFVGIHPGSHQLQVAEGLREFELLLVIKENLKYWNLNYDEGHLI